jgi:hypothetical protein
MQLTINRAQMLIPGDVVALFESLNNPLNYWVVTFAEGNVTLYNKTRDKYKTVELKSMANYFIIE